MGQKRKEPLWNSVDLFDIVRGELLDEGYSEQDAMYIMANLDDEQREIVMNEGIGALLKGLKGVVKVGKKLLTKSAKKGGKSEISKRAGRVVKDQRAGVMGTDDALNKAQQSLDKSMSRLRRQDTNAAARAAMREKNRLNNLDPVIVGRNNRTREAAQIRQRNRRLGRPEWAPPQPIDSLNYKSGDPWFTRSLRDYYADKRAGIKGLDF